MNNKTKMDKNKPREITDLKEIFKQREANRKHAAGFGLVGGILLIISPLISYFLPLGIIWLFCSIDFSITQRYWDTKYYFLKNNQNQTTTEEKQ